MRGKALPWTLAGALPRCHLQPSTPYPVLSLANSSPPGLIKAGWGLGLMGLSLLLCSVPHENTHWNFLGAIQQLNGTGISCLILSYGIGARRADAPWEVSGPLYASGPLCMDAWLSLWRLPSGFTCARAPDSTELLLAVHKQMHQIPAKPGQIRNQCVLPVSSSWAGPVFSAKASPEASGSLKQNDSGTEQEAPCASGLAQPQVKHELCVDGPHIGKCHL